MNTQPLLTYSEIMYLFGDKAVSDRSRLVNYDKHPSGEKISVKPLSHTMVIAALVYLSEHGYLSLTLKEVKKMLFFGGKDVIGKKLKEAGPDVTGIEKKLLENFKNETEISKAVYWILDSDETSPWGQVAAISKNSLADKGYLSVEKSQKLIFVSYTYHYGEKKLEEVAPFFEETKKHLKQFSEQKELYKKIEGAVKNGIASRLAQSDSSD